MNSIEFDNLQTDLENDSIYNRDQALKLAKGCYQRNLIIGGSTLRGSAKSAKNLIGRLKAAGIAFSIERGPRGGWSSAKLVF